MEDPSDEDLRRFDRKRKDKTVGNAEWASPIDPDSRIMKMKDGRTHFTYKAEHTVDLDSDLAVTAEIYAGDTADGDSLLMSVQAAQDTLAAIGADERVEEIVAIRGTTRLKRWGYATATRMVARHPALRTIATQMAFMRPTATSSTGC